MGTQLAGSGLASIEPLQGCDPTVAYRAAVLAPRGPWQCQPSVCCVCEANSVRSLHMHTRKEGGQGVELRSQVRLWRFLASMWLVSMPSFYLTMSVVDKYGFITNFLKCFQCRIPFRSFLESWGALSFPSILSSSLAWIRWRVRRWSWRHELRSAFELQHTLLCVERQCWKESDFLKYASDA